MGTLYGFVSVAPHMYPGRAHSRIDQTGSAPGMQGVVLMIQALVLPAAALAGQVRLAG